MTTDRMIGNKSDPTETSQRTVLLRDAEGGGGGGGEYGSTGVDNRASGSSTVPAPVGVAGSRPFPFRSVFILAMCMTLNSYTLVNLFPYVGMMVKGLLGLTSTNEVGFYAGYVASSFTFGRFLSGYFWGSLTDRVGRKPVIIIGLLSMMTFSLAFGVSGTYSMALASRFILGLTNHIMAALRTSVSEICGPEHVVVGMTYLTSIKAISMVIGTGVGGLLAQPALHFPGVFPTTGLFGRYPFLLPNLVGAVMSLLALLLVIVYIPETKEYTKRPRNILQDDNLSPEESPTHNLDKNSSSGGDPDTTTTCAEGLSSYQELLAGRDIYGQVGDEIAPEECADPTLSRCKQLGFHSASAKKIEVSGKDRGVSFGSTGATDELSASEDPEEGDREPGLLGSDGLLATPHVVMLLLLGCMNATLSIGFDELYPLYALSTPDVGGLGWSPLQIGKVLVATGVLMAMCQLVLFPPLIKMVGIMTWQRLGCGVGVAAFAAVPAIKTFSWDYNSLFIGSVLVNAIATFCLGAVNLALVIGSTNLVSANMRGKLGGIFNMAESLGRFLGPAGYSITYAWSVSASTLQAYGGWVDYRFAFYASSVILAVVGKLAWGTLTLENLMKPECKDGAGAYVSGGDGNVDSSMKDITRTPSRRWAAGTNIGQIGESHGSRGKREGPKTGRISNGKSKKRMPTAQGYTAAPGADAGTTPAGGEGACFPTRAVAILTLGITVNSYAMVSLFPYVGMMVKELLSLKSTNEAGFYAGYLASAFIFGRFLSGYVWGYCTDSIGRKPVIIAGLLSVATFSLAFGFSTSYTWAVSWRLILGLTNGNVPALRSSISEVCGPEHVVVGMTYLSSGRAISMVFGTGIGGLLAQPAVNFSGVFSTTGLFGRYPFLLPNLVGAWYELFVLVLTVLYLPETKDYAAASKQHAASQPMVSDGGGISGNITRTQAAGAGDTSRDKTPAIGLAGAGALHDTTNYQSLTTAQAEPVGDVSCRNPDDGDNADDRVDEVPAIDIRGPRAMEEAQGHDDEEEEPGVFGRNGLLAAPNVKALLVLGCTVQAHIIGFEEVFPLFALSTPDVGGLGWDIPQIGTVLVVTGVLMSVLQLVFFPPFIKAIGIAAFQRLGFMVGIPAFLAVPAIKTLSWNYPSLFAASVAANALVLSSLCGVKLALAIGSTTMVPSRMRGKLGGMFNTAESVGRFIGPAGFAVAYAWSISTSGSASAYGWVNHNFVFYTSAVVLSLCAALAWPTLTAENLMKWEDADEAAVGGSFSGDQSHSAAGSLSPVGGRSVHVDDAFASTAAVDAANSYTMVSLFPYVGMMVKELLSLPSINEAGSRAISMVFGTGIGGLLARPAVNFSRVFSTTSLFGRYPFLLPNLVGAWYALFVLVLAVLYLPETKDYAAASKQHAASKPLVSDGGGISGNITRTQAAGAGDTSRDKTPAIGLAGAGALHDTTNYQSLTTAQAEPVGDVSCRNPDDGDNADDRVDEVPAIDIRGPRAMEEAQGHDDEEEEPGVFGRNGLLAAPNVKALLVLGCTVQAHIIGFEEVFPLFALSTPDVGGLGWDIPQIGTVLVVTGVLMSVLQLVFFPPFIKPIGIAAFQRLGFLVGIPAFLAVPAIKTLSWNYPSLFVASVAANALVLSSLWMVNLALVIGSTTMVPSRMRGKLGGTFHTAESLGRCVGPAGFAITYAWSISTSGSASAYGWVNHNFVFYTSAVVLSLCVALAWQTLTAENLMKWEDVDEAAVGGSERGDQSDSAGGGSLSPVGGRSVHLDDAFASTAAVDVAGREADLAVTIGFEEVFPLFALSTPDVGGLGWNTLQVGTVLVVTGVLMSTVQLVFFPPLIKVVGIAAFQRLGFVVGIPAFLAVPVIKMLSWNYPSLFAASVAANAFVLCSLWAVNLALAIGSTTTVPSRMRGKLGGMFHTAESLGRSIGPAGFAVAYAWSISTSGSACAYGWVNHGFVFQTSAVMLTLCAALAWATLTAENLMKWEDDDEAAVGGSLSGDQSDSAACPLPPVGARSVHTDDVLFSTAVVEVGRREADLV
eukprot:g3756.t1